MLIGLLADTRIALRHLLAAPVFSVFALVSLMLGFGVSASVYSVVSSFLWRPAGIHDAGRVFLVVRPDSQGENRWRAVMSIDDFEEIARDEDGLGLIAASEDVYPPVVTPAASEVVHAEAVSGHYFQVVGATALVGRTLEPADDNGGVAVAVLSYHYWRTTFAGDPAIVGRSLKIGDYTFEIVGVAPNSLYGLSPYAGARTEVWVPLKAGRVLASTSAATATRRQVPILTVVGRVAADRTIEGVTARLNAIGHRLDAAVPLESINPDGSRVRPPSRHWSARPAAEAWRSSSATRLGLVAVILAALVLVVACTNLAALMLARGVVREREFAIRSALGATRWRLVRAQCVESTILAGVGGLGALVVARGLMWLLVKVAPVSPDILAGIELSVNIDALAVGGGAVLVAVFTFGVEPALEITRRQALTGQLVSESGSVGVLRPSRQRALIRWQVAISVCFFLIVAMLARLIAIDIQSESRVSIEQLGVVTVDFRTLGWSEPRARQALQSITAAVGERPDHLPVAIYSGLGARMPLASLSPLPSGARRSMYMLAVTPEIFETLGIRLTRGRGFGAADDDRTPFVVVVSEKTAQTLFGTVDAVGRQASVQPAGVTSPRMATVIGVAKDIDCGDLFRHSDEVLYVSFAQHYQPAVTIVVRARQDPERAVRELRSSIRQVDPNLSILEAGTGSLVLARRYLAARFVALAAASLGVLTLALGMIGLYGVQSEAVSRRTREFGVRLALGANARSIVRMVILDGVRPVIQGLLMGLLLGILIRLLVRVVLVSPTQVLDPISLGLVPLPFLAIALLACALPARRAARTDPNVSLRHL